MRRLLMLIAVAVLALTACANDSPSPAANTNSTGAEPTEVETMTDGTLMPETPPSATESMATEPSATMSTATITAGAGPPGTVITTASSDFGEILFDGDQQAIYLFDKETTAEPECYDACATAWPPVLTTGAPVAAGAIAADLLGTTTRTEGTTQVTYAGHPLYYYVDEGPGEVKCHNVQGFDGLWLVVTPSGRAAA